MKVVLVVDDSPTIRRMVKVALAELATTFVEAASGLEAIEQLTLNAVQLIVLDLNMPDMHGLEVLKFVRRHPTYRNVPVMILTTRGDETSRELAMKAGATAYLTKPFSPTALAEQARSLVGAAGSGDRTHVEP
jgi:two-component system, chemotaxis family, chemotaxis protein CheY